MALLDLESEMARARDGMAFANSTEGQSWMSLWCADCLNDTDEDCPLLAAQLDELLSCSKAVIRLATKLRASQRDAQ